MGVLWRVPKAGGSMNQELNLVTRVVGNGMNRKKEKTMGMMAPLTSRAILCKAICN